MNKFFLAFLLGSLLVSCDQTVDSPTDIQHYSIEQFMNNQRIFGSSFSPDEQNILVSSNKSGIFNAYALPLAGGESLALTSSEKESIFAVSYFPNDRRILFRSDDNGNEIWHLFMRNEDGSIRDLTPDSTARATFFGWAHDGKSFFFGYTKRDPRLTDVYEMNIKTLQSNMIYQNDKAYAFGGISNDKNYLAFVKPINTNDSELFLYDRRSKELKKISEKQAAYDPADFSTDSKYLYYLTDDGSEFSYLTKYQIDSGAREKVQEENWDVVYAYFSHNGKYRVVGINEDGKTVVKIYDTKNGSQFDFPKFENGDLTSVDFSKSEKLMSFYVGSSASPSNLYVFNFETKKYKQLTNTLNKAIDPDHLVTARVIRFKSFDGLEIPAIYYQPHQASAAKPLPALVWVHGGPGGQSRQRYSGLIQYLVNHGYAILAVNNRGSSGYGKTFYKMDDRNHGEKDLMDCVYGKKYLQTLGYIDKEKIGIIGGSYGGFMVMAALTQHPEEFEVGVDLFGVTNWLRTLKSIPPWWESFKDALYEEMGDPVQDSVRLYGISPLFHANKIVKPVMVLQGVQDPRVLKVESDEIVEAVRKNNIPVEYVLFDDEGHGFVKKENQIEGYGKILQFLDNYLKKEKNVKG